MKRLSRTVLMHAIETARSEVWCDEAQDIINSDAAQKRTIRELRKEARRNAGMLEDLSRLLGKEGHPYSSSVAAARDVLDAALKPRAR